MTSRPLLLTKLHPPSITDDLVQRPHLMQLLHDNHQRPLTLVSAPAGFGKSVVVRMWLQSSGLPYGWVSLDETDNDLSTFLDYLLAAMRHAAPNLEFQTQSLLELPTHPPLDPLIKYLLNDISDITEPCVLVLDDMHHIHEPSVFRLLNAWLQHPPGNVHLVIISRWDPPLELPSLRARNRLTEIRTRHLRFIPSETATYMKTLLKSSVSDEIAEYWTSQTEGWIVGLRLAALSLLNAEDAVDLHAPFHDHTGYLADYLMAEVMASLPATERQWLLKTSLLNRFCAPLCDTICAVEDSSATTITGQSFISWLRTANLFIIELDSQQTWFRFHDLFREQLQALLKQQLRDEEIADLRRSASRWFEQNQWIDEALQLSLLANDIDYAIRIFSRYRRQIMNHEEWHRLEQWLKWFPADAITSNPVLVITQGYLAIEQGVDSAIVPARDAAKHLLIAHKSDSPNDRALQGEIAGLDTLEFLLLGQAQNMMSSAQRALELLPPESLYLRTMMNGAIGVSLQLSGHFEESINMIRNASIDVEWSDTQRARMCMYLDLVSMMEGDLSSVLAASRYGLPLAVKQKLWHVQSMMQYFLGIAHYLRGEWVDAEPVLQSLTKTPELAQPSYVAHGACTLARIYHLQGQADRSTELLERVSEYLVELDNRFVLEIIRAFQVELALNAGDTDSARGLATSVNFDLRPALWFHYLPQLTAIRILVANNTSRSLEEASTRLQRMRSELLRVNRKLALIDVLVLQALVHFAQGNTNAACTQLAQSLTLAKPGRFIRNYVDLGEQMADLLSHFLQVKPNDATTSLTDYVKVILASFPQHKSATEQLLDTLTQRELEILESLTWDCTIKEIAAQLHIEISTVRTHTKRIYRKLDARSRFEAVQRAKELGLL